MIWDFTTLILDFTTLIPRIPPAFNDLGFHNVNSKNSAYF